MFMFFLHCRQLLRRQNLLHLRVNFLAQCFGLLCFLLENGLDFGLLFRIKAHILG